MSKYCYNQLRDMKGLTMQENYGPGPSDAGQTTVNAPALPSIKHVPNVTALDGRLKYTMKQTDGKQIPGYHDADRINVGQGTNHKGNQ